MADPTHRIILNFVHQRSPRKAGGGTQKTKCPWKSWAGRVRHPPRGGPVNAVGPGGRGLQQG
eukprot:7698817-Alexandrium_andersonii.AAC.1